MRSLIHLKDIFEYRDVENPQHIYCVSARKADHQTHGRATVYYDRDHVWVIPWSVIKNMIVHGESPYRPSSEVSKSRAGPF
jgi:hypothetical protein